MKEKTRNGNIMIKPTHNESSESKTVYNITYMQFWREL